MNPEQTSPVFGCLNTSLHTQEVISKFASCKVVITHLLLVASTDEVQRQRARLVLVLLLPLGRVRLAAWRVSRRADRQSPSERLVIRHPTNQTELQEQHYVKSVVNKIKNCKTIFCLTNIS